MKKIRANYKAVKVGDVVHWFTIKVINERREIVEFLSWSGLKWELRLKYDWYFKYRAASGYLKEFDSYKRNYCELFPIVDKVEYKEYVKNIKLLKRKIERLELELCGNIYNSHG